jgi:hypothetical protein
MSVSPANAAKPSSKQAPPAADSRPNSVGKDPVRSKSREKPKYYEKPMT